MRPSLLESTNNKQSLTLHDSAKKPRTKLCTHSHTFPISYKGFWTMHQTLSKFSHLSLRTDLLNREAAHFLQFCSIKIIMSTFFWKFCKISLLLLENKFNQIFENLQPIKQLYRRVNFHKNPTTPSTQAIYTTPLVKFCIKAFHLVTN